MEESKKVKKMAKSIIHLKDIEPKNFGMFENCYVELEPNIKRKLFDKATELSPRKSLVSLSEMLNMKLHNLSDGKNRNPIRLTILKKLSDLLVSKGYEKFSLKNIEKNIKYIKGTGQATRIFRPKFPFDFATPEGVRIISKLFHDGGIWKNRQPYYRNSDHSLIDEFCEDVKNVFGKLKIVIGKDSKGMKVALPRLIGDIFELTGYRLGSKVLGNPSPPSWVKNLDVDLIKEFIRVAMDDEGSVGNRSVVLCLSVDVTSFIPLKLRNRLLKLAEIERTRLLRNYYQEYPEFFKNCKSKILLFDKKLIEKLGVETSDLKIYTCYTDKKNEKLRITWSIYIYGKDNLAKFNEKIGFKLNHKKVKLKEYLKNTRMVAKNGQTLKNLLKMCSVIEKKRDYLTDWDIAEKFRYNHNYIGIVRRQGEERNLIKRVGREGHKLKYVLTELGKEMLTTGR